MFWTYQAGQSTCKFRASVFDDPPGRDVLCYNGVNIPRVAVCVSDAQKSTKQNISILMTFKWKYFDHNRRVYHVLFEHVPVDFTVVQRGL